MSSTPSKLQLRAGLVVDVEVGETLTLHPAAETRWIVVRLLEKNGRRARLRVQALEEVQVSRAEGVFLPASS